MPTIRTFAALSLAAALGSAGLVSGAAAGESCETYGRLALQQQKQNEDMKCGFSGAEWSSDLKAHISWCGGVGAPDWQQMLKKRTKMLDECKSKS
jgi:hypothetical protein